MPNTEQLIASIASTISDYRPDTADSNQTAQSKIAHVTKWAAQFEDATREPLLRELDGVLKKTYWSRTRIEQELTDLVDNQKITKGTPANFWSTVGILKIQRAGASQRDMLGFFDGVLRAKLGFGVNECKGTSGEFIYIDDGIFSGLRASQDLLGWIRTVAPKRATVHLVAVIMHSAGDWYIRKEVKSAAANAGKEISLQFWCCQAFENRHAYRNVSDVLSPSVLPNDERVQKYAKELTAAGYPPSLRQGQNTGTANLFSSHDGRSLLEREFLRAGAYIREVCPNLPDACRPLGFSGLRILGFGAMSATYRNCPNNCPLALWVGSPWYPLLPRKTNAATELEALWL